MTHDLEAAVRHARRRYSDARDATARCLYAVHKLDGEAARQRAVAATSRREAQLALEARDTRRSRALVSAARTALDLAKDAEQAHAELRRSADAALEDLRTLARTIAALERERLRATPAPRLPSETLETAQRALDLIEAERELDLEI